MGVQFTTAKDATRCPRCGNVGRVSGDDPEEVCGKCEARAASKLRRDHEDK